MCDNHANKYRHRDTHKIIVEHTIYVMFIEYKI